MTAQLTIGAIPRNLHSRFTTFIEITEQLDFGAITYTQGQLRCNTHLLNFDQWQLQGGIIQHTGDISKSWILNVLKIRIMIY